MQTGTLSNPRRLKLLEKIERIISEGNQNPILEFGVFEGYSMSVMVSRCRQHGAKNLFYGFDSFSGIPMRSAVWEVGMFTSSLENTKKQLTSVLGSLDEITFVPGIYSEILCDDLREDLGVKEAALVHIDSDTYESAVDVLKFCQPLIKVGTIVVFDDWTDDEPSEVHAWEEFCEANDDMEFEDLGQVETQKSFVRIK
jgi:cephalosporin hydroxylase